MLTDDEIIAIGRERVRQAFPDGTVVIREFSREPDGIYFSLESGGHPLIGLSSGFLITRETGEAWDLGVIPLEWYREGWRPGIYRLNVREVKDPHRLASIFVKHCLEFLIREVEHGVVWDRRAEANEEDVVRRLTSIPCSFSVSVAFMRAVLPLITEDIAAIEYSGVGEPWKYDWRPENNTPDQLGVQWEW